MRYEMNLTYIYEHIYIYIHMCVCVFILGAFAKLRKATNSLVVNVRLSVRLLSARTHGITRLPMNGLL